MPFERSIIQPNDPLLVDTSDFSSSDGGVGAAVRGRLDFTDDVDAVQAILRWSDDDNVVLLEIDGDDEYSFSSSSLNMHNNNIINVGNSGGDWLANSLSIGSGDSILSSGAKIKIQPGVDAVDGVTISTEDGTDFIFFDALNQNLNMNTNDIVNVGSSDGDWTSNSLSIGSGEGVLTAGEGLRLQLGNNTNDIEFWDTTQRFAFFDGSNHNFHILDERGIETILVDSHDGDVYVLDGLFGTHDTNTGLHYFTEDILEFYAGTDDHDTQVRFDVRSNEVNTYLDVDFNDNDILHIHTIYGGDRDATHIDFTNEIIEFFNSDAVGQGALQGLYLTSGDRLFRVDTDEGTTTPLTVQFGIDSDVRGIAWSGDTMYAVGGNVLYTIDIILGGITRVHPTNTIATSMEGLSFHGGTLYGIANDDNLYSIDTTNGTSTLIGDVLVSDFLGALASNEVTLYMADRSNDSLYSVNVNTGASTLIGSFNLPVDNPTPRGLAWDSETETMYLADARSDSLYTVNLFTGNATRVHSSNTFGTEEARGLTFVNIETLIPHKRMDIDDDIVNIYGNLDLHNNNILNVGNSGEWTDNLFRIGAGNAIFQVGDNVNDVLAIRVGGIGIENNVIGISTEFIYAFADLDMQNNTILNVGNAGGDWTANSLQIGSGESTLTAGGNISLGVDLDLNGHSIIGLSLNTSDISDFPTIPDAGDSFPDGGSWNADSLQIGDGNSVLGVAGDNSLSLQTNNANRLVLSSSGLVLHGNLDLNGNSILGLVSDSGDSFPDGGDWTEDYLRIGNGTAVLQVGDSALDIFAIRTGGNTFVENRIRIASSTLFSHVDIDLQDNDIINVGNPGGDWTSDNLRIGNGNSILRAGGTLTLNTPDEIYLQTDGTTRMDVRNNIINVYQNIDMNGNTITGLGGSTGDSFPDGGAWTADYLRIGDNSSVLQAGDGINETLTIRTGGNTTSQNRIVVTSSEIDFFENLDMSNNAIINVGNSGGDWTANYLKIGSGNSILDAGSSSSTLQLRTGNVSRVTIDENNLTLNGIDLALNGNSITGLTLTTSDISDFPNIPDAGDSFPSQGAWTNSLFRISNQSSVLQAGNSSGESLTIRTGGTTSAENRIVISESEVDFSENLNMNNNNVLNVGNSGGDWISNSLAIGSGNAVLSAGGNLTLNTSGTIQLQTDGITRMTIQDGSVLLAVDLDMNSNDILNHNLTVGMGGDSFPAGGRWLVDSLQIGDDDSILSVLGDNSLSIQTNGVNRLVLSSSGLVLHNNLDLNGNSITGLTLTTSDISDFPTIPDISGLFSVPSGGNWSPNYLRIGIGNSVLQVGASGDEVLTIRTGGSGVARNRIVFGETITFHASVDFNGVSVTGIDLGDSFPDGGAWTADTLQIGDGNSVLRVSGNNSLSIQTNGANRLVLSSSGVVLHGDLDLNSNEIIGHNFSLDTHNHNTLYSGTNHNHAGTYAPVHSHPYSGTNHDHDSDYSGTGHNHTGTYAPVHNHPYSANNHNHNTIYSLLNHGHFPTGGAWTENNLRIGNANSILQAGNSSGETLIVRTGGNAAADNRITIGDSISFHVDVDFSGVNVTGITAGSAFPAGGAWTTDYLRIGDGDNVLQAGNSNTDSLSISIGANNNPKFGVSNDNLLAFVGLNMQNNDVVNVGNSGGDWTSNSLSIGNAASTLTAGGVISLGVDLDLNGNSIIGLPDGGGDLFPSEGEWTNDVLRISNRTSALQAGDSDSDVLRIRTGGNQASNNRIVISSGAISFLENLSLGNNEIQNVGSAGGDWTANSLQIGSGDSILTAGGNLLLDVPSNQNIDILENNDIWARYDSSLRQFVVLDNDTTVFHIDAPDGNIYIRNSILGELNNNIEIHWEDEGIDFLVAPEGVMYAVDNTSHQLFIIDRRTGTAMLVHTTNTLMSDDYRSLAYDGTNLYSVSTDTNRLYVIDTEDGTSSVVHSSNTVTGTVEGMAWDGSNMYAVTDEDNLIRINLSNGTSTIIGPLGADIQSPKGLAWDGEQMYTVDAVTTALYTVNLTIGVVTRVHSSNMLDIDNPQGLTWDGHDMYLVDRNTDTLGIVDRSNGTSRQYTTALIAAADDIRGIAWVGPIQSTRKFNIGEQLSSFYEDLDLTTNDLLNVGGSGGDWTSNSLAIGDGDSTISAGGDIVINSTDSLILRSDSADIEIQSNSSSTYVTFDSSARDFIVSAEFNTVFHVDTSTENILVRNALLGTQDTDTGVHFAGSNVLEFYAGSITSPRMDIRSNDVNMYENLDMNDNGIQNVGNSGGDWINSNLRIGNGDVVLRSGDTANSTLTLRTGADIIGNNRIVITQFGVEFYENIDMRNADILDVGSAGGDWTSNSLVIGSGDSTLTSGGHLLINATDEIQLRPDGINDVEIYDNTDTPVKYAWFDTSERDFIVSNDGINPIFHVDSSGDIHIYTDVNLHSNNIIGLGVSTGDSFPDGGAWTENNLRIGNGTSILQAGDALGESLIIRTGGSASQNTRVQISDTQVILSETLNMESNEIRGVGNTGGIWSNGDLQIGDSDTTIGAGGNLLIWPDNELRLRPGDADYDIEIVDNSANMYAWFDTSEQDFVVSDTTNNIFHVDTSEEAIFVRDSIYGGLNNDVGIVFGSSSLDLYASTGEISQEETMWFVDRNADALYTINKTTGVTARVHATNTISIGANSLVWVDGVLYTTDGAVLYTIDTETGLETRVHATNTIGSNVGALAWDGTTLYAGADQDDSLYTVNKEDGTGTLVGSFSGPTTIGGLTWNGTALYLMASRSLYTVDTTNGSATLVGTLAGAGSIRNLTWDGEFFYGLTTGGSRNFYRITVVGSSVTGVVITSLDSTLTDVRGMAYRPAVSSDSNKLLEIDSDTVNILGTLDLNNNEIVNAIGLGDTFPSEGAWINNYLRIGNGNSILQAGDATTEGLVIRAGGIILLVIMSWASLITRLNCIKMLICKIMIYVMLVMQVVIGRIIICG